MTIRPADSTDAALRSITDAFAEVVVASGYAPTLDDTTVDALADHLAAFFTAAGIPVNPAEAVTHFARRDRNDQRLEELARRWNTPR